MVTGEVGNLEAEGTPRIGAGACKSVIYASSSQYYYPYYWSLKLESLGMGQGLVGI